jgi:hypothetical protein
MTASNAAVFVDDTRPTPKKMTNSVARVARGAEDEAPRRPIRITANRTRSASPVTNMKRVRWCRRRELPGVIAEANAREARRGRASSDGGCRAQSCKGQNCRQSADGAHLVTGGRDDMPERGYIMKITVDIDCTPAEAREFMGLPDVKPMQAGIMEDLEKVMRANLDKLSPESILRTWLALTPDAVQETFKGMLNLATTGRASSK